VCGLLHRLECTQILIYAEGISVVEYVPTGSSGESIAGGGQGAMPPEEKL